MNSFAQALLDDLAKPPDALGRLGEELFLRVPLYKSKKQVKPLYINEALWREKWGLPETTSWEQMASTLAETFSFTIEEQRASGEPIGWAYVDRQYDPLDVSLCGNEGSGRAYYVGRCFNIKGEKTPLATSQIRKFSDGYLEVERGIWESIVSNVLDHDFKSGVSPVLAILDLDEMCNVLWREESVRRVFIVRIDDNGSLDRITHHFFNKTTFSPEEMAKTARHFGLQSAEKFMHRILHGAWSPGNITMDGHLIDFDTICAVKGRQPHYSFTRWHAENYFGFEHEGLGLILDAMAGSPEMNAGKVSASRLKQTMTTQMYDECASIMPSLMGFEEPEKVYKDHQASFRDLIFQMIPLAQKFYPKMDGLNVRDRLCCLTHLFDFASFMRSYPLLKRLGHFSPARALQDMGASPSLFDPFAPTPLPDATPDALSYFEEQVYPRLEEHIITTPEQKEKAEQKVLAFIEAYDSLFSKISAQIGCDPLIVEARAYAINEDRFYLFPSCSPSYVLANKCGADTPNLANFFIHTLIRSAQRSLPEKGWPQDRPTDLRLTKSGYSCTFLDGKGGFQHALFFHKDLLTAQQLTLIRAEILPWQIDGNKLSYFHKEINYTISLWSDRLPLQHLMGFLPRESSLYPRDMLLGSSARAIEIEDFLSGR